MNKWLKIIFIISVVIVVAFAILEVYLMMSGLNNFQSLFGSKAVQSTPQETSHIFAGQVISISPTQIEMYGTHVLDSNPSKTDYSQPVHVIVQLASSTIFVKTTRPMASKADLTSGNFDVTKLAPKKDLGSISDIKNSDMIEVETSGDSFSSQNLVATRIDYDVSVPVK